MNANDTETTVAELRDVVRQFVDQRDWQVFHHPKNLSMSLAIEVAELMEHFQWLTAEECERLIEDPSKKRAVEEELADCLSYVLALANAMKIDLSQSLRAKMIQNAVKYPPPESLSPSDHP